MSSETRLCIQCNCPLTQDNYIFEEQRGEIYSSTDDDNGRCRTCCAASNTPAETTATAATKNAIVLLDSASTARRNNSSRALFEDFDLDHPFASGAFRWVAKGKYIEGDRMGEACVCKWFKTGGVVESHYYSTDIACVEEAVRLITKWNSSNIINRLIKVNQCEVWEFDKDCRPDFANRKVLQEPFIDNYQKFNSNSGWADDSFPWSRVMQALSHFSYHISNGHSLLCDLQGGVMADEVVLTDPVVMSPTRCFGPTDLGPEGIRSFFAHHQCNEFCRPEWRKVRNAKVFYRKHKGTTMEAKNRRKSRAPPLLLLIPGF